MVKKKKKKSDIFDSILYVSLFGLRLLAKKKKTKTNQKQTIKQKPKLKTKPKTKNESK